MTIHEMRTMVARLRIYWKAKKNENREMGHEDDCPRTLVEVDELTQNVTVGTLKIEMDRINAKMNDLKSDIIEASVSYTHLTLPTICSV